MRASGGVAAEALPNPLGEFIRLNRFGTLVSAVLIAAIIAIRFDEGVLYVLPGAVFVGYLMLFAAGALFAAGRLTMSLGVVAVGNWMVAIVAVFLLPWLLPVNVMTAMMPVVLATPYVERARLWPFLVGTAMVLATLGWLGTGRDNDGAIEGISDEAELAIVVLGLIGTAVPIGVVVWQANRYHRSHAIAAVELSEQLGESRRRLVVAGDDERARIERDLHDGAQQRLIAVAMRLRMMDGRSESRELSPLISEVEEAMADIRRLSNGLSPALLETAGLNQALSAAARRLARPVDIDVGSVGRLDRSVETALYFCGIEALQNALKHADGRGLRLSLCHDDGDVILTVSDAGAGFDSAVVSSSNGMVNMGDRIASVGGALDISSTPGVGTTVRASVPDRAGRFARSTTAVNTA